MKISKEILMAMGLICLTSGAVMACDSIQAYAHPTLFGSQGHSLVTTQNDVIIGKTKCCCRQIC